jgi:tryptophanyl-tRNA synthetase
MSKSYGNTIDPFMDEKPLRKRIMKIVTDSADKDEPKDPDRCTVFALYRGLAGREDARTAALADRYRAGGMGYGEAKQALFELILDEFAEARRRRAELTADPGYVSSVLRDGAIRARAKAEAVLARAREATGLIGTESSAAV